MIILNQFNPRGIHAEEREALLKSGDANPESVVLSTCQRIEFYTGNGHVSEELVNHLFSLAAGLKSNIPGDGHVLGQIRKAYTEAAKAKTLDKHMHRLFQKALQVGKEARSRTNIGRGAVSYAHAAVTVLSTHHKPSFKPFIVIIGVNPITRGIIRLLKKQQYDHIIILNRSIHKGKQLAISEKVEWGPLSNLKDFLARADILITCTSAKEYLVHAPFLPSHKKMLLIDLAIPPDIDPGVKENGKHVLFTIDDVEKHIQSSLLKRKFQEAHVKKIVTKHAEDFMRWQQYNKDRKIHAA